MSQRLAWNRKDLIDVEFLSRTEIDTIFTTASAFKEAMAVLADMATISMGLHLKDYTLTSEIHVTTKSGKSPTIDKNRKKSLQ